MPLRSWVGTEPVSTREERITTENRKIITERYVLAGANLSVTFTVPQGRAYYFRHAYIQVNTSAGGATFRQALFGLWINTPTRYGGASTNIAAYASSMFSNNKNHLLMFVPCGNQTLNAGENDQYYREQINVAECWLEQGDWFRLDVFQCTAGDIVTVVITTDEVSTL